MMKESKEGSRCDEHICFFCVVIGYIREWGVVEKRNEKPYIVSSVLLFLATNFFVKQTFQTVSPRFLVSFEGERKYFRIVEDILFLLFLSIAMVKDASMLVLLSLFRGIDE
ncbi:hypothetical protein AZF06_14405 [Priestia endophytica]|uniref:Uncharacterized protein n=2 Tax=Priestia endophytica TaxID=135735 RepID=A0A1I6AE38_9BACI|nr:hypothetical protein AZF06_14405 [Priestia endophytica]SFQ66902.1 hypothetical protein SAMN02745910_02654 [Priestia endophytica DSM 13796]